MWLLVEDECPTIAVADVNRQFGQFTIPIPSLLQLVVGQGLRIRTTFMTELSLAKRMVLERFLQYERIHTNSDQVSCLEN